MLPKLPHKSDLAPRPLETGQSARRSLNMTQHARYLSYDQQPTEIGRLKKVKQFLCSDEQEQLPWKCVLLQPTSFRSNSRNKQNAQPTLELPYFRPKERDSGRVEHQMSMQHRSARHPRMKLREIIDLNFTVGDAAKQQNRLCDRLRVSKLL